MYVELSNQVGDLLALSEDSQESRVVLRTEYSEGRGGAALSSDGRWLAYATDATGVSEVWVRPYAEPGGAVRVSPQGGVDPVWSRDGRELFYLEGDRMMAVAVSVDPEFDFEPATFLFEARPQRQLTQPPFYDVASDGRFILVRRSGDSGGSAGVGPIQVVQNWHQELLERVPIP